MNYRTAKRIIQDPNASEARKDRAYAVWGTHVSRKAHNFYTKKEAKNVLGGGMIRHVPDAQSRPIFK